MTSLRSILVEPDDFALAALREADLPMLRRWLLRRHVARWWGPAESTAALREQLVSNAAALPATRACIASLHGRPIGYLQSYVVLGSGGGWWENETDPGARGCDQFIAHAPLLGRGLGTAMLRGFVRRLFADPQVSAVQTDPHPDNLRAIRCYLRAGFAAVGPVTTPDGPALLMRCARPGQASRDNPLRT